ncbi:MAG: methyltransferase domain-containing protein [Paracoccaceae bacterium]|nr:MAG: methyltransferase domain-containing protein [Paracoccaceae bacterium]
MTIFDLFAGLDRCAPGDAASVARVCAGLAPGAAVLDAGCGRGGDLPAILAAVPGARVVAVDAAEPFVAHVASACPQVRAVCGDMADPPGGPFDLIWSGGAIYNLGVTPALRAWRAHLAPGGRVAFSDLVLRGDAAPFMGDPFAAPGVAPELADFFAAEGVTLRGESALRAEVAAAGFRVVDTFWMPDSAWADYYLPLEPRLGAAEASRDLETRAMAAAFRHEIALWRQHGMTFGYLVCVAVPE